MTDSKHDGADNSAVLTLRIRANASGKKYIGFYVNGVMKGEGGPYRDEEEFQSKLEELKEHFIKNMGAVQVTVA